MFQIFDAIEVEICLLAPIVLLAVLKCRRHYRSMVFSHVTLSGCIRPMQCENLGESRLDEGTISCTTKQVIVLSKVRVDSTAACFNRCVHPLGSCELVGVEAAVRVVSAVCGHEGAVPDCLGVMRVDSLYMCLRSMHP